MRRFASVIAAFILVISGVILGGQKASAAYAGALHLPWPQGTSHSVTQTPGPYEACGGAPPLPSHCTGYDTWAYDFGMSVGESVAAAHDGTVLGYENAYGSTPYADCQLQSVITKANYIVLNHNDGYSSQYWHLDQYPQVAPNQFVYQGHPLGGADTSGAACGTHLHFAVEPTPVCTTGYFSCIGQSQQISFVESGEPAWGCCYASSNRIRFSATWLSQSSYLTLSPGQLGTFTIQYLNNGYDVWNQNTAGLQGRLGTWSPTPGTNQPSLIGGAPGCAAATDWLSCTRITTSTVQVDPNQSAWFQFQVRGPVSSGTYRLYLRPLIENVLWMEDVGLFVQVTVP